MCIQRGTWADLLPTLASPVPDSLPWRLAPKRADFEAEHCLASRSEVSVIMPTARCIVMSGTIMQILFGE